MLSWWSLNLVLLLIYLALMILVGKLAERKASQNLTAYLLAGRKAGLFQIVMSFSATAIGASALMAITVLLQLLESLAYL
jgi:Na+/proline symporter